MHLEPVESPRPKQEVLLSLGAARDEIWFQRSRVWEPSQVRMKKRTFIFFKQIYKPAC